MLLIILNFCSKNNQELPLEIIRPHNRLYPIVFSKGKDVELDIISKENGMFESIDISSYLYIGFYNSNKDKEIWQLTDDLEVKENYIIKRGQGPGEALNLMIFGGNIQEILGYDLTYKRLLYWNKDFNKCRMKKETLFFNEIHFHSYAYSPVIGSLMVLEEKAHPGNINKADLVLSFKKVNDKGRSFDIHHVECKVKEVQSEGRTHRWHSRPLHAILIKDHLFVVNLEEYIIYKYNLSGKLLRNVRIVFSKKSFSGPQLKEWLEASIKDKKQHLYYHFPGALWPACWLLPFGDGFAVGRRDDYNPSDSGWINCDYFDLNMQYLGMIRIPAFKEWNHPFFCQSALTFKVLSKQKSLYFITMNETNEKTTISEWTWKHGK